MSKHIYLALSLLCAAVSLHAQQDSTAQPAIKDSAQHNMHDTLHEVIVRAYEQESRLVETPAAIGMVNADKLSQYNNTSILPAVNTVPGVRMEERSPGSYRFSIRGSSLASPFGVRNVKVYYNDIPYTQAGGNTYLNQLGFYNFQSLTIIKGPGSSIYGAGTGGTLLINSIETAWQPGAGVSYTAGSYGLSSTEATVRVGDSAFKNSIRYQHLAGDGYRQQSRTHKDVLSWDSELKRAKGVELDAHFLYGNLYYQTPGALTLNEYNADARQARPGTATAPGAIGSQAAISQKSFLAGFTYRQRYTEQWSNATTLFADYATQQNPNLRNYSRTSEPGYGGRTVFTYKAHIAKALLQWNTGAEWLQGITDNRTYKNINGTPQYLQADQEINNRQLTGFTQLSAAMGKWQLTGGVSVNRLQTDLATLSAQPYSDQSKTFNNQLAPRVALLRKVAGDAAIYASAARGFSPPTIDELAPTGSKVNFDLSPEAGWNYELGTHAYAADHRLFLDVSLFYFGLQNAIVQRKDSLGGDYYLNAGSTKQAGVEAYCSYSIVHSNSGPVRELSVYASYTGNDFHYNKFVQVTNDYSGRQLPGTAPNTVAAGVYLNTRPGIYVTVTNFYSDKIALNDANSAYSKAYNVLSGKAGYRKAYRRVDADLYAGADNMLNERYSLGNDINAAGGRYYNTAAPVNYYIGLTLEYRR